MDTKESLKIEIPKETHFSLDPYKSKVLSSNCLEGKTLVFSGVLPNLHREEAIMLAKKHGATIRTAVSGKTDFLILGENLDVTGMPFVSHKHQKANEIIEKQHEEYCDGKIKLMILNETGFIQLIHNMLGDDSEIPLNVPHFSQGKIQGHPYILETDQSGRAHCTRCDESIAKGSLRVSHVFKPNHTVFSERIWHTYEHAHCFIAPRKRYNIPVDYARFLTLLDIHVQGDVDNEDVQAFLVFVENQYISREYMKKDTLTGTDTEKESENMHDEAWYKKHGYGSISMKEAQEKVLKGAHKDWIYVEPEVKPSTVMVPPDTPHSEPIQAHNHVGNSPKRQRNH